MCWGPAPLSLPSLPRPPQRFSRRQQWAGRPRVRGRGGLHLLLHLGDQARLRPREGGAAVQRQRRREAALRPVGPGPARRWGTGCGCWGSATHVALEVWAGTPVGVLAVWVVIRGAVTLDSRGVLGHPLTPGQAASTRTRAPSPLPLCSQPLPPPHPPVPPCAGGSSGPCGPSGEPGWEAVRLGRLAGL